MHVQCPQGDLHLNSVSDILWCLANVASTAGIISLLTHICIPVALEH